jgi:hypothetical protein
VAWSPAGILVAVCSAARAFLNSAGPLPFTIVAIVGLGVFGKYAMPNGKFERMISDIWGRLSRIFATYQRGPCIEIYLSEGNIFEGIVLGIAHGNPIVFGQEDCGEIDSRLFDVARRPGGVVCLSRSNNPGVLPMVIATLQRREVTAARRRARLRGGAR